MRLFKAALNTCLDSPFFASLSVHGLHFTVYAPSRWSASVGFISTSETWTDKTGQGLKTFWCSLPQDPKYYTFLGFFPNLAFQPSLLWRKLFEGDGADRAAVIGLIRQVFTRVGLEADQADRDRVSSDQGFLIGRSGCDRSDQGQLSYLRPERCSQKWLKVLQEPVFVLLGCHQIQCEHSFVWWFGVGWEALLAKNTRPSWSECQTNERQSRDSNLSTTNAGSVRTNFCVFEGDRTANER